MKKMIRVFSILFSIALLIGITSNVFALGNGFNENIYNSISNKNVSTSIATPAERIVGTICTILQILAVGGIVALGVKYMFSGASDKANIKQTLIYAVIGLILVFSASAVVKMVIGIGNDLL